MTFDFEKRSSGYIHVYSPSLINDFEMSQEQRLSALTKRCPLIIRFNVKLFGITYWVVTFLSLFVFTFLACKISRDMLQIYSLALSGMSGVARPTFSPWIGGMCAILAIFLFGFIIIQLGRYLYNKQSIREIIFTDQDIIMAQISGNLLWHEIPDKFVYNGGCYYHKNEIEEVHFRPVKKIDGISFAHTPIPLPGLYEWEIYIKIKTLLRSSYLVNNETNSFEEHPDHSFTLGHMISLNDIKILVKIFRSQLPSSVRITLPDSLKP